MKVNINDFSNGSIDNSNPHEPKWDGTGVFDIIIKAANENIKIQNQTSRITGAEYAEVYLGTMQSAIAEAMKFLLAKEITEKEISLKEAHIETAYKEISLKEAQIETMYKEISLKEAQIKTMYVERVIKDKEAAALGMDKVVKVANTAATTEAVYKPKYEEA